VTDVVSYCSQCGLQVQPEARFCGGCGQAVGSAPATSPSFAYAAYGSRVAAWMLDFVVLSALLFAFAIVFVIAVIPASERGQGESGVGILIWPFIPLYGALCHRYWHGQTLGKRALGIAVEDVHGGPVSLGQALGRGYLRALLVVFAYVPWIVDSLWPLWQPESRSLHDLAASTIVVRRRGAAPSN
jgi:uncharacterized RDD family membrane protein YckC